MTTTPRFLWVPLACVLLVLAANEAIAHVRLVSSSPARAETLATPPTRITLVFSEPVQPALTTVLLLGPAGDTVALSAPRLATGSDREIVADLLGESLRGEHIITWRTVSADGHPVSGRIPFVVEPPALPVAEDTIAPVPADLPPAPPAVEPPPEPTGFHVLSAAYVVMRWAGYTAILLVFGAVAFALLVLPMAERRDTTWTGASRHAAWRARRLGVLAAVLFLLVAVARLMAQATALHGAASLDIDIVNAIVLETAWGRAWIAQVAAGMVLLALLMATERRWALLGTAMLLPVVAASLGAQGHALTAPWPAAVLVTSHALHLLGAGIWLGTLAIILLAGLPASRAPEDGGTTRRIAALIHAFSPMALACGAVVLLTGVLAAVAHLGSVDALWRSEYGRALIVKLGLLAVVGGLGSYNWRRVRPALAASADGGPLRLSAGLELGFALLVILVTAVLVATPPPT